MTLVFVMAVSACGKKPPHVDVPDNSDSDSDIVYPLVYPDPKTNK